MLWSAHQKLFFFPRRPNWTQLTTVMLMCDLLKSHDIAYSMNKWKHRTTSYSTCCVMRVTGITDLLISLYHRALGSPSALEIWRTVNEWSRVAITVSHSDPAAAQSQTLVFVSVLVSVFLWNERKKKNLFPLSDLSLYPFFLSPTPGIYSVIIFQSHLPIHLEIWFVLYMESKMWAMKLMFSG